MSSECATRMSTVSSLGLDPQQITRPDPRDGASQEVHGSSAAQRRDLAIRAVSPAETSCPSHTPFPGGFYNSVVLSPLLQDTPPLHIHTLGYQFPSNASSVLTILQVVIFSNKIKLKRRNILTCIDD